MSKTVNHEVETINGRQFIHPNSKLLVFDESLNSRASRFTPAEIQQRAESIITDGQLQPVELRPLEDGKFSLTFGAGRLLAARKIVEKDKSFRLWVSVVETDDKGAFLRSVRENYERKETTPIDDAVNMAYMIQPEEENGLGMNQKEVAEFYRCTPASVSQKLSLLRLSKPMQKAISDGKLPMRAALDLLAIENPSKREKVFAAEMEKVKNGLQNRVSTRSTRSAVRSETANSKAPEPDPVSEETTSPSKSRKNGKKAKAPPAAEPETLLDDDDEDVMTTRQQTRRGNRMRTVQEVRELFSQMAAPKGAHPEPVKKFAADVVAYISGEIEDGDVQSSIYDLLGSDD